MAKLSVNPSNDPKSVVGAHNITAVQVLIRYSVELVLLQHMVLERPVLVRSVLSLGISRGVCRCCDRMV